MTASVLARSAQTRGALLAVGPRGRAAARHGALPEGTHMMSGEAAADQQSDSSWSFPVRIFVMTCDLRVGKVAVPLCNSDKQ